MWNLMFCNSLRISEVTFCVFKLGWETDSQSFTPVLHSTSKQHIGGGREHSSPIQSIPSPEFHSCLHCKGGETSPIGKLLLKMHHVACQLGTCLHSTQIHVVYRWKELHWILLVSVHRPQKNRLFKKVLRFLKLHDGNTILDLVDHRQPYLLKMLVNTSSSTDHFT